MKPLRQVPLDNPIAQLDKHCTRVIQADVARGKKNKLSERDLNRVTINAKRQYNTGFKISLDPILEDINSTKIEDAQISKPTLSRHLRKANIVYSKECKSLPRGLRPTAVPRWLAKRRSFTKRLKGCPKANLFNADESYFGFSRKTRMNARELHPLGVRHPKKPAKFGTEKRVTVWAAIGIDCYSQLCVFEHGKQLNGKDYVEMLKNNVFPDIVRGRKDVQMIDDGASIHWTVEANALFEKYNVKRIKTPPYSCDAVWIEKFWANLADIVYEGNKTFTNKSDLIQALHIAYAQLTQDDDYLRRLVVAGEGACRKIYKECGYLVH